MRTGALLAFTVLMLILMQGCVVEKDVSAPENEKVLSMAAEDLDLDNYTDFKAYVFRAIVIDAENSIMMQKSVSAAQSSTDLKVKNTRELSDAGVSRFETLIFQFDIDRKDKEAVCAEALGLGGISQGYCESPEMCARLCTTAQCQQYGYVNDLLGYWMHDFSQKRKAISDDVNYVRTALIAIKGASPQEKELVMGKLSSIMDRTLEINTNPLLNENMFGICRYVEYDNSLIREMLSLLGEYERTPRNYTYSVMIKFVISGKDYTELKISDSIPEALATSLRGISPAQKGSAYDNATKMVSWPTVALNLYPQYMVGYSFQSGQDIREDIFENWPTSKISTKVVSLTKSPVVAYILNTSKYVYSICKGFGYYPALALVLVFWDITFFMLLMAAKMITGFVGATFSRASLRDSLVRAFGGANPYWKEYGFAAILFFIIGYALLTAAAPVAEESLAVDLIGEHLVKNPAGALSLLFIFLSLHTGYALLEDRFKGVIAGRRYYENVLDVSAKANELRLKKLRERADELKQRLANAYGLDVSEEKGVHMSLPMERLGALVKKEGSERTVKELIESYLDKVERAIDRVDEKARVAKEYWADWSKEISEKLEESDKVQLASLLGIPAEWRLWAADRYASENEEEGLVVDAENIKRSERVPEMKVSNMLKKLSSKGLAYGGIILKEDGVAGISSTLGNRTLESVLAWKLANYAKILSRKVLNSDYARITIAGSKNAVVFSKIKDKEGVLFAPKEKIREAFVEFESRLKKL